MTLPKGFKPKDTKKTRTDDSRGNRENNTNNAKTESNQIKVAKATSDDFINKQENKIVADNITSKEEVTVDDISVDEGTATITTVTTTPAPGGEVLSETEMKVPLEEQEKEVLSETEMKVAASPASDSSGEKEKEDTAFGSMRSESAQNDPKFNKETMQYIYDNKALFDETRNNIRRATDEARKDIPRYTQAANEYQEQTIQTAREIADNFLESQKEIINSVQSAWLPQIDAANRVFVSSWLSPTRIMELYSRMLSSFLDNVIVATRVVNNTVLSNIESFNSSMLQTKDNSQDISRIGVNMSKSFSQTLNTTGDTNRGDPDQIPREGVPGQVEKIVSQQGGVEGQRKEVNVESYSKAASLGQILKDLDFPANRAKILQFVEARNREPGILSSLQRIEDRQYQNVSEVAKSAGLIY
jgi:Protein of unknown function (DUF2795)